MYHSLEAGALLHPDKSDLQALYSRANPNYLALLDVFQSSESILVNLEYVAHILKHIIQ